MPEHKRWLHVARIDLLSAKGLLNLDLFTTAIYHCHQAAEKSLKAYLALKGRPIVKTHDLIELVDSCKQFDATFEKTYEAAKKLNPLATKFRYPTEFDMPNFEDTEQILKYAKTIYRFALKKTEEPDTGQGSLFDID